MLRIITLFFALSLILTVAFPAVDAHIDSPLAHRHAPALNRMIRKRAGNTPDPASATPSASSPSSTDAVTPISTQSSATDISSDPVARPSATSSAPVAPTLTPDATQASTTSTPALLPNVVKSIVDPLTANASTSTSASSTATSSSSSSSHTLSSPSPTPSAAQSSTPAPGDQSLSSVNPVTITSSAPVAASTAPPTSGTVTKLQRNTIIILIAIGGSIGAAGIIWTIIRKWKFSPSRSSDDRLQPIDWQPTTGPHDDHDITEKLTRNGSTRSHGSFTSGNNNHDNLAPDLPPHDFTAGPAHLAAVGGYADLQRGPSPHPDLQRGPSIRAPADYQYEIPNPHGQYYNGASVGAGAYQGGYNRGY